MHEIYCNVLPIMSDEFHVVASVTGFYTINTYCIAIRRVARLAAIKVVHRKRGIRRNFIQTLAVSNSFLYCVLIIKYFVS